MLARADRNDAGQDHGRAGHGLAAVNVFGGFLVTGACWRCFKKKAPRARRRRGDKHENEPRHAAVLGWPASVSSRRSGPSHRRRRSAATFRHVGMAIAVLTTAALIVQLGGSMGQSRAQGMVWWSSVVAGAAYGAGAPRRSDDQDAELWPLPSMIGLAACSSPCRSGEPWAFGIVARVRRSPPAIASSCSWRGIGAITLQRLGHLGLGQACRAPTSSASSGRRRSPGASAASTC